MDELDAERLDAARQLLVLIKEDYELLKMRLQRKGRAKRLLEDEIKKTEKL